MAKPLSVISTQEMNINMELSRSSIDLCSYFFKSVMALVISFLTVLISASVISKLSVKRISILIDFANRIPELYLKATLEEKRLILNTITESIIFDEDTNRLKVKLRPVFEHLRQMKAKRKQEFSANLKTLTGTLETHSESAKKALKNNRLTLSNVIIIGTRKSGLNTEIEPRNESSKKLNVDGGT